MGCEKGVEQMPSLKNIRRKLKNKELAKGLDEVARNVFLELIGRRPETEEEKEDLEEAVRGARLWFEYILQQSKK